MLVQTVKLMQDIAEDYVEFESDDDGVHRAWACGKILHKYLPSFNIGEFEIYDEYVSDSIKIHFGNEYPPYYLEVNNERIMDNSYKSPLPEVALFSKLRDLLSKHDTIWIKYKIIETIE